MRIAIMQPYFFPYLGYYRLLSLVDLFVVFDCVQFPRRGWVHRNKLTNSNGKLKWLTLPLRKDIRDAKILDLRFRENAEIIFHNQINSFPVLIKGLERNRNLNDLLFSFYLDPVQYLVSQLSYMNDLFNFGAKIIRSSSLSISPELKGNERIISIIKLFDAKNYLNSPGGISLYDKEDFNSKNINLEFLSPYNGSFISVLERLLQESTADLKSEIINNIEII